MSEDEQRNFVSSSGGAIHYTQHLTIEVIGRCMHLQDRSQDTAWMEGRAVPLEDWA